MGIKEVCFKYAGDISRLSSLNIQNNHFTEHNVQDYLSGGHNRTFHPQHICGFKFHSSFVVRRVKNYLT